MLGIEIEVMSDGACSIVEMKLNAENQQLVMLSLASMHKMNEMQIAPCWNFLFVEIC